MSDNERRQASDQGPSGPTKAQLQCEYDELQLILAESPLSGNYREITQRLNQVARELGKPCIFGINFNGMPIPDDLAKRFAKEKHVPFFGHLRLQGVTNDEDCRDAMLATANNGRRQLQVVSRNVGGRTWHAIYTS